MGVAAMYYGLRHVPLGVVQTIPRSSNVVLFLCDRPLPAGLRAPLGDCRVLAVSLAGYDSSLVAALYTQRLVMTTNYTAASRLHRGIARSIVIAGWPLRLDNSDDVSITVHGEAVPPADPPSAGPGAGPIPVGQLVDVMSYCQVTLASPRPADVPGVLPVTGSAVATAVLLRSSRLPSRDQGIPDAHRLLVGHCPVTLEILDGTVTGLRDARGRDVTGPVRKLVGGHGDLLVRQAGIGANESIRTSANWAFNSPMHVGAGTVHLAVGVADADREVVFIMVPQGAVAGDEPPEAGGGETDGADRVLTAPGMR